MMDVMTYPRSTLGLKLIHVSKRGPRWFLFPARTDSFTNIVYMRQGHEKIIRSHCFMWDVITYPRPKFNCSLARPPLKIRQCCRGACQISERSDNSKYKSRGFETLRDLTIGRLIGYWYETQVYLTSAGKKGLWYKSDPAEICGRHSDLLFRRYIAAWFFICGI